VKQFHIDKSICIILIVQNVSMFRTKNLIIVFMLLVLSILCIEVLSHFVLTYQINPQCQFRMNPIFSDINYRQKSQMCDDIKSLKYYKENIRLLEPNQHYPTIHINSFGFRGDEFNKIKQNGEYRVFIVGSSMIFGLGATSDDTTIPSILQEKFHKSNLKLPITVVNAGYIAATSASETYLIKNILPEYKPDLIIVYEGYNDSWEIPVYDISVDDISNKTQINDHNFIKSIKDNFGMFATPKLIYQKIHDYFVIHELDENKIKKNVELWKNRWITTCNLQKDTPIVIMMQPVSGLGNKSLTITEQQMNTGEKHHSILRAYEPLVIASSQLNPDCHVYDLTHIFDSHTEQIFVTSGHLTDNGNEIIAQKMFEVALTFIPKIQDTE